MPISSKNFKEKGKKIGRRYIQDNVLRILKVNPDVAISSKELGEILDATPQSINQSLRSLEDQGLIIRGLLQDDNSGQMVCYSMEVSHARAAKEQIEKDRKKEE